MKWSRNALPRRVHSIPELSQRFAAEVARVGREPVWDKQVLLDRLAQVNRILSTAPSAGRTAVDVKRFVDYRPVVEAFINAGGTNGSATLP